MTVVNALLPPLTADALGCAIETAPSETQSERGGFWWNPSTLLWEKSTNDVSVDSDDTTSGFLADKLVAGSGITLTVNNSGSDETLEIVATGGGSVGTWANANVTWKSGTNAVTLHADSQQRYIVVGKLVTLAIYLKAGSAAAASGTINISGLPAPIAGTFSGDAHVLGASQVRDQGVAFYNAVVTAFDNDTLHFWNGVSLLAFKIDTSPPDEISFTIQYETP